MRVPFPRWRQRDQRGNFGFSLVCRVLLVASWPGERGLERFHCFPEEGETRRKRGGHTSLKSLTTNRGVGLWTVGPSGGPIELSSDRYWSFATAGSVWLNRGLSIETSGQPFELKVANN